MVSTSEWFSGLATVVGFTYFMVGFASAYVVHCIRAKIKHKKVNLPWHLAGIVVGVVAILVVSVQSSHAYNLAAETAAEVQQCQREFNDALRARSKIAQENDGWSSIQRKALTDWLAELLNPPADIKAIRDGDPNFNNDPRYQAWGMKTTIKYFSIIQKAQDEQEQNQKERDAHPLPEPTCGK